MDVPAWRSLYGPPRGSDCRSAVSGEKRQQPGQSKEYVPFAHPEALGKLGADVAHGVPVCVPAHVTKQVALEAERSAESGWIRLSPRNTHTHSVRLRKLSLFDILDPRDVQCRKRLTSRHQRTSIWLKLLSPGRRAVGGKGTAGVVLTGYREPASGGALRPLQWKNLHGSTRIQLAELRLRTGVFSILRLHHSCDGQTESVGQLGRTDALSRQSPSGYIGRIGPRITCAAVAPPRARSLRPTDQARAASTARPPHATVNGSSVTKPSEFRIRCMLGIDHISRRPFGEECADIEDDRSWSKTLQVRPRLQMQRGCCRALSTHVIIKQVRPASPRKAAPPRSKPQTSRGCRKLFLQGPCVWLGIYPIAGLRHQK